jgi:hypothetical protein
VATDVDALAPHPNRGWMYIDDFIWLPDVVEKLAAKHQLTQDEVLVNLWLVEHLRAGRKVRPARQRAATPSARG